MSEKEREQLKVFERVKRGELRQVEAAEICGLSYRQTRRQYQRYREFGDRGLVHRGRGRPSNRKYGSEFRAAVLARYQERYPDFGPTLATEKLGVDGYELDHETLRQWLLQAKLWRKRRKRARHRSWRERRAHFGELVQMDGSHHQWFERRGPKSCLMNMVDDATSRSQALMAAEETSFAAMELLWRWIERYGVPRALYTDRKNVYVLDKETRARAADSGQEALSQFGRACRQLGIKIIEAYSPEAKGRVERSHGTYQDRLVKELRLAEINSVAKANQLLPAFTDGLNEKFAVPPRAGADYHRSVKGYNLAAIFCHEEERTATSDWVVRFENQFYQLEPRRKGLSPRDKIKAQRYLNGELHFRYGKDELSHTVLPERPQPAKKTKRKTVSNIMDKYVPPPNHVWRNFQFGKRAPWLR